MSIVEEVKRVLAAAKKLTGPAGNEANTKSLLIEPMLAALGWDTADIDHVVREWRVFDGTSLDYALKIDDRVVLHVEAKGVKRSLDDKQFIAQTVNYANNEGVVWCVLTNGLTYRVYKTNEPVAMAQKLLFEVDLADIVAGSLADAARSLWLLSRESLMNGDLDLWGERVFTDTRIRKALAQLAADPPRGFLSAIEQAIGTPAVARDRITESLSRVLNGQIGRADPTGPQPRPRPDPATRARSRKGPAEYPIGHHLDGKPAVIVDIFERLDEYGRSLGPDVTCRVRKQYVGYFKGKKSFFSQELQRQRVIVYLGLDARDAKPWNDKVMRDVANIGHFGLGSTEYSLRSADRLDEIRKLIELAYEKCA
jgi:hypothetical protein